MLISLISTGLHQIPKLQENIVVLILISPLILKTHHNIYTLTLIMSPLFEEHLDIVT